MVMEDAVMRRPMIGEEGKSEEVRKTGRFGKNGKPDPVCPAQQGALLDSLSNSEIAAVERATEHVKENEEVVSFPGAGIRLLGSDMKQLRGTRWLNDELINAYAHLINQRNDQAFGLNTTKTNKGGDSSPPPDGVPNAYMLNSFFFTRLTGTTSGYDYEGVRRWTRRSGVDVLRYDLILVPVNIGNHHWVMGGVDMKDRKFMYLDSMRRGDTSGVVETLRRWLGDEVSDKHGEERCESLHIDEWGKMLNEYSVRRAGVIAAKEEREAVASRGARVARVPLQTDNGSCGVFASMMADCLSLGIEAYAKQENIRLVRNRMTLDLIRKKLPIR